MSRIVEFRVPVFIEVEDADAATDDEAEAYAILQLDNQSVWTVISEALEAKTSFGVGDDFDGDDTTVNEAVES